MHASERNRLKSEIRRLRHAEWDMRQVVAAAEALAAEHTNGALCRALETAIVVCYARPFNRRNTIGALEERWAPEQTPRLHAALLELRDIAGAHTDKKGPRDLLDVAPMLGMAEPAFEEEWQPIRRDVLPTIIAMCEEQRARFRAAADALEAKLSGSGGPAAGA